MSLENFNFILSFKFRPLLQELADVKEQLRDVMVHLKAQSDLAHTQLASQTDIQAGRIIVPDTPTEGATGRRKSKKPR